MNNHSGKVMTVFLVIFAILLISMTAVSTFFFNIEIERRKSAEASLESALSNEKTLREEVQKAQKQVFLLKEKSKEADERINSLMDDLELEQGLRQEVKQENISLKERIEKATAEKKSIEERLSGELKKVTELEAQLKEEKERVKEVQKDKESLKATNTKLVEEIASLKEMTEELSSDKKDIRQNQATEEAQQKIGADQVQLERIVVAPTILPQGRILSVDLETEFVIVNLGEKDGAAIGSIMSVFRGDEYLGDIKLTRVQAEMSAADLIPPFSSKRVRKNDQVTMK